MNTKLTFSVLISLFFINVHAQLHFPGGVAGAETWYMVKHSDFDQQLFVNSSTDYITITSCNAAIGSKSLFNFNHSIAATQLCLKYNAALENTTSRNVFFVGEPKENTSNFSHLTVGWNTALTNLPAFDSVVKNRFDLGTVNSWLHNKQSLTYQGNSNANVNFYHWNIYQMDRKYKSYGFNGESTFYIGKEFTNALTPGLNYHGNFPEFISFPFELTSNQRNRVESYLALKYGITLRREDSYKNSKNLVFWDKINNLRFQSRIFGIGRDDISGLNQLQSESVHFKDYLVTSVGQLAASNPEKQDHASIENNHFIVFADNGQNIVFDAENDFGARVLSRKWLSQNTGENADVIPMSFKVNISGAMAQALALDPSLKLWMLHDKYVTNQEVSDFNNNYVEYYEPTNVTPLYGFFDNVLFDPDNSIYDQYTFGVGPQMIVQVRFDLGNCEDLSKKADVIITGGRAPYTINIVNTGNYNEDFVINENTLEFQALAPYTYTVYVVDSNGNDAIVEIEVNSSQITVDLGPDQILNSDVQQVILDAGVNVTDSNATYQWSKNNELLADITSILVAVGPGEYKVTITSADHSCQVEDSVILSYNFAGTAWPGFNCDNPAGTITVNLTGGTPPYTTVISNTIPPISQVHNTDSFLFSDVAFGSHTVTTTDANGSIFTSAADIPIPFEGLDVDLISQLSQQCSDIQYEYFPLTYPVATCQMSDPITLDASVLVTYPNTGYEWFMDGQSLGIYDPLLELYQTNEQGATVHEVKVEVMNLDTGCSITENFGIKGGWSPSIIISRNESKDDASTQGDNQDKLIAIVYPNPSDAEATFNYKVTSSEIFEGFVEIYTPIGSLLSQTPISGSDTYILPFTLLTSGMYMIITRTNDTIIYNTVIIN